MKNTIKNIIKKSNHSATEFMLAYIDGKTDDEMIRSIIINTIENSNHPKAAEALQAMF